MARDLAPILEYQEWRNFNQVIEKAKIACKQANLLVTDHFGDFNKMVDLGSGAKHNSTDFVDWSKAKRVTFSNLKP